MSNRAPLSELVSRTTDRTSSGSGGDNSVGWEIWINWSPELTPEPTEDGASSTNLQPHESSTIIPTSVSSAGPEPPVMGIMTEPSPLSHTASSRQSSTSWTLANTVGNEAIVGQSAAHPMPDPSHNRQLLSRATKRRKGEPDTKVSRIRAILPTSPIIINSVAADPQVQFINSNVAMEGKLPKQPKMRPEFDKVQLQSRKDTKAIGGMCVFCRRLKVLVSSLFFRFLLLP